MSRILFSFMGGHGHFVPLVPLAEAARAAGHDIAFACGASMCPAVQDAGFTALQLGPGSASMAERGPLRPLDLERELDEFRDRFVGAAPRHKVPLLLEAAAAWRAQALVCDEADFGSQLAAERLGLPCAIINVMAAGSFVRAERIGPTLAAVRAELGLPTDPPAETRRRVFSPFPPGFRDPAFPLPPDAFSFRPYEPAPAAPAPTWIGQRAGAPLVYFSLGTVFNVESGDLFNRVLAGLSALPVNVFVTVGHEIDPAEFGQRVGHVRIERFVPQTRLLPHCDLVVSHGGSGSVAGALAHGVPMLLIPLGADQPLNADRVAALGLGRWLDPVAAEPVDVRAAAEALLGDLECRQALGAFRDSFAALPGREVALAHLEALIDGPPA